MLKYLKWRDGALNNPLLAGFVKMAKRMLNFLYIEIVQKKAILIRDHLNIYNL